MHLSCTAGPGVWKDGRNRKCENEWQTTTPSQNVCPYKCSSHSKCPGCEGRDMCYMTLWLKAPVQCSQWWWWSLWGAEAGVGTVQQLVSYISFWILDWLLPLFWCIPYGIKSVKCFSSDLGCGNELNPSTVPDIISWLYCLIFLMLG